MILLRWLLLLLIIVALLFTVRFDDAVTASHLARADEFRATYLYRQAADHVRVAATRQPWNATLQLRLAQLMRLQRDFDQAAAMLDQAQRLGADPIELAAERARLAEAQGNYAAAAAQWQIAAEARPGDALAPRRLIDAQLRAGNLEAAQAAAQRHKDRLDQAQLMLGKLQAIDDPNAARAHFEQAIGDEAAGYLAVLDQPDAALRLLMLGRLYLSSGDLALARRAFESAAEVNPAYAEAHAYAGFVIDELGDDGAAELDRAVELAPELVIARYFRARHALQAGQIDQALNDLNIAAQLDAQNPLIAVEIGRAHLLRDDLAQAEAWLVRARDLRPDEALGWKALAELYAGRGYGPREQAVSVAQAAVQRAPFDAEAHVWLAAAYLAAGERGAAEGELQRAQSLNPTLALTYLYLGRLYGRNTEVGQLAYERAIALDPDGPIGVQARRTLELP